MRWAEMASVSHILSTERETRLFRLLALVVATIWMYFQQEEVDIAPTAGLILFFFAYTLSLGPLLRGVVTQLSQRLVLYVVLFMVLVDLLVVSFLVHFSGGVNSITVILIPLFIMYHAIYLNYLSGLLSATLFSALYVSMAFWSQQVEGNGVLLAGQLSLFYLLAIFSSHLALKIRLDRAERELLQEFVASAGREQGIDLEELSFDDGTVSVAGEAADEATMERFLDALRRMRKLSAVNLIRVGEAERGKAAGKTLSFTLRARVR